MSPQAKRLPANPNRRTPRDSRFGAWSMKLLWSLPRKLSGFEFVVWSLFSLAFALLTSAAFAQPSDKTDWWSFKPASRQPLPHVKNTKWARNPIDLFVLAKLEQEKMAPSQPADRRTLIRRLSFDLIGLPPTPAEVTHFLADRSPQAYENLVDRLLASPRYGERWARHWLDTVHYGETYGYDKDKPRPNAWPFRDYVIRSLNRDKPYSRFVEDQSPGEFFFHEERDDVVMTTMSTFESLPVHCARCHNHKFDPITQKDYYSLQAVFAGVDRADRPFDSDKQVFAKRRALLQKRKPLEERHTALTNEIVKISSPELQKLDGQMKQLKEQLDLLGLATQAEKSPGNGYHSGTEINPETLKWVQVDLGQSLPLDEVRLVPARPIDFPDTPGFGFPVRFRGEISDEANFTATQAIADHTTKDFQNRGDKPVPFSANGKRARYVRVTATKLWERTSDYVFALAELQVLSGGTNVALGAAVSALDSIEAGYWSKKYLVDGFDSRARLTGSTQTSPKKKLEAELQSLAAERRRLAEASLDEATRLEIARLTNQLSEFTRELSALPPATE